MTRSFGDLCVKAHGVTAEPEIARWEPQPEAEGTCYILIASDGIWEFLDTPTVSSMVSQQLREGKSLQDACISLSEVAKSRWAESEPEYCDDISIILLPVTGEPLAP